MSHYWTGEMNPVSKRLRRAAEDAINAPGMRAGSPKCTVDAASLLHILDRHDKLERLVDLHETRLGLIRDALDFGLVDDLGPVE